MSHFDFSSYSPQILADTLRILRDYKSALRQLGKRAILSDRRTLLPPIPHIEYAQGIESDLLKKYSEWVVKQYFPEYRGTSEMITYSENDALISWVRVHFGDDLVDVSFQKFTQQFRT